MTDEIKTLLEDRKSILKKLRIIEDRVRYLRNMCEHELVVESQVHFAPDGTQLRNVFTVCKKCGLTF